MSRQEHPSGGSPAACIALGTRVRNLPATPQIDKRQSGVPYQGAWRRRTPDCHARIVGGLHCLLPSLRLATTRRRVSLLRSAYRSRDYLVCGLYKRQMFFQVLPPIEALRTYKGNVRELEQGHTIQAKGADCLPVAAARDQVPAIIRVQNRIRFDLPLCRHTSEYHNWTWAKVGVLESIIKKL